MQPVVHSSLEKIIATLHTNPPQSLLVGGQRGLGVSSIARSIAGTQLMAELHPQNAKDEEDRQNGTISAEAIRDLYTKTRAKYSKRQFVIIDGADRMSSAAQGAFLKLLEEPNEQIYFILASHNPDRLLPTIRSRVQTTVLRLLSDKQTERFIVSLGVTDATKTAQLRFIAAGLPAELARLVADDEYFKERAELMSDARAFLQADTYRRLIVVHKYRANRDGAIRLIDSAMQILRHSISAKPQQQLVSQLDALLKTKEHIASNFNVSLQLTQFVL